MNFGKVHMILGRGYDCNTYVVLDRKKAVIDPGIDAEKLQPLGIKPADVALVINTHCHYDHTAQNARYENAKIVAHRCDLEVLNNQVEAIPREINLGETTFQVLHTPGHTAGSISLHELKLKILICGDLCFENGIGRTDLPGGSEDDLKKSLRKILKLDINYILPGHGPFFRKSEFAKRLKRLADATV